MEVGRIDSGLGCLTKESKFMRRNISEMAGIAYVVLNNNRCNEIREECDSVWKKN
jgi:hypothetical protein